MGGPNSKKRKFSPKVFFQKITGKYGSVEEDSMSSHGELEDTLQDFSFDNDYNLEKNHAKQLLDEKYETVSDSIYIQITIVATHENDLLVSTENILIEKEEKVYVTVVFDRKISLGDPDKKAMFIVFNQLRINLGLPKNDDLIRKVISHYHWQTTLMEVPAGLKATFPVPISAIYSIYKEYYPNQTALQLYKIILEKSKAKPEDELHKKAGKATLNEYLSDTRTEEEGKEKFLREENNNYPPHIKEYLDSKKDDLVTSIGSTQQLIEVAEELKTFSEEDLNEYLSRKLEATIRLEEFLGSLRQFKLVTLITKYLFDEFTKGVYEPQALSEFLIDPLLMSEEERHESLLPFIKQQWNIHPLYKIYASKLTESIFDSAYELYVRKRLERGRKTEAEKLTKNIEGAKLQKAIIESSAVTTVLNLFSDEEKRVYELVKELNLLYNSAFEKQFENPNVDSMKLLGEIISQNEAGENWLESLQEPEKSQIAGILSQIKAIKSDYQLLYDPVRGNLLSGDKTTEQEEFENRVKETTVEVSSASYKDKLKNAFESQFLLYQYYTRLIDTPLFKVVPPEGLLLTPEQLSEIKTENNLFILTSRQFTAIIENEVSFEYTKQNKGEKVKNLRTQYLESKSKFLGLARAYLLNQDPAATERAGFWATLGEQFGEMTFWENINTNQDFIEGFIQAAAEEGLQLTEAQIDRAKLSFMQKAGEITIQTIPLLLEIAAATVLTEGLAAIPEIINSVRILRIMMVKKYGKLGLKAFNALVVAGKTGKTAAAFGLADPSLIAEGIGEGLAQQYNPFLLLLRRGEKWNKFAVLFTRIVTGAAAETITEFTGQYVSEVVKEKDLIEAFGETFGRDFDEAKDKLLLTAFVCSFYSGTANVVLLTNLKRGINTSAINSKDKKKIEGLIEKRLKKEGDITVIESEETISGISKEEYQKIKTFAESKGLTEVKRVNGRWQVKNKFGNTVNEYEISKHRNLIGENATNNYFQSHHGIQNVWGEKIFNKWVSENTLNSGIYDTFECPTINLRDSRKNNPHYFANQSQLSVKSNIHNYKYSDMRIRLEIDLDSAGVPKNYQTQLLEKSDNYFGEIYLKLKTELINRGNSESNAINKLEEIFGSFKL